MAARRGNPRDADVTGPAVAASTTDDQERSRPTAGAFLVPLGLVWAQYSLAAGEFGATVPAQPVDVMPERGTRQLGAAVVEQVIEESPHPTRPGGTWSTGTHRTRNRPVGTS